MLSRFNFVVRSKMMNYGTVESVFLDNLNVMTTTINVDITDSWVLVYRISEWFGVIYRCFTENNVFIATILRKTLFYRLMGNILWKNHMKVYYLCVSENKIFEIFIKIHGDNGHWVKTNIFVRLKNLCYWCYDVTTPV